VAVSLRGRYYFRSGSCKVELKGNELNDFLLKKAGKTWDDIVEEGASIDDMDESSINKFLEDAGSSGRMPGCVRSGYFRNFRKTSFSKGW
jgi:ATP-dependent DNA helicase RecG